MYLSNPVIIVQGNFRKACLDTCIYLFLCFIPSQMSDESKPLVWTATTVGVQRGPSQWIWLEKMSLFGWGRTRCGPSMITKFVKTGRWRHSGRAFQDIKNIWLVWRSWDGKVNKIEKEFLLDGGSHWMPSWNHRNFLLPSPDWAQREQETHFSFVPLRAFWALGFSCSG